MSDLLSYNNTTDRRFHKLICEIVKREDKLLVTQRTVIASNKITSTHQVR